MEPHAIRIHVCKEGSQIGCKAEPCNMLRRITGTNECACAKTVDRNCTMCVSGWGDDGKRY